MLKFIGTLFEGEGKKYLRRFIVCSAISPVADLFSFSMILLIMNRVISAGEVSEGMVHLTFAMIMFSILKVIFEIYKNRVSNEVVYKGACNASAKVYDLIMNEDILHHNDKDPMKAVAIVREDVSGCISILMNSISIMVGIFTTLGYGAALIFYAGWIGILIVAGLLIFMSGVYYINRRQIREYGEQRRQLSIRTNAQITTAFGAFKEMKIDNRSEYLLDRYKLTNGELAEVQTQFSIRNNLTKVMMHEAVMIVMFLFLGLFMMSQRNVVAMMSSMVIYMGVLLKMVPVMYGIVLSLNGIDYSKKSYEVLKDNMERYHSLKLQQAETAKLPEKKLTFTKGLEVSGLTFGYREDKKIFDNASISIPAGKSVAIIGQSGAGKTTFLDLVLGLLPAECGEVYYDDYELITGADPDGKCRASLGDIVSYIPQTVYLNGETVKHNVAFFEDEAEIDSNRIEECLKCAQIWDDVKDMPDGIDTMIGANGTAVSGGQRQRIALARALYKEFELLVMDEATAALDMETEKAVIDSIRQVKGDKTLLMVTHHMSLADECDMVYRIENKGFVRVR